MFFHRLGLARLRIPTSQYLAKCDTFRFYFCTFIALFVEMRYNSQSSSFQREGSVLGSVLIVNNDRKFDSTLLKWLEQNYKIYFATDGWDALDIISEYHIDVPIVMSDDHHEAFIEEFFKELEATRSAAMPVILISANPNPPLQAKAHQKGWYLIKAPIEHQLFIDVINRTMIVADALNDKTLILEKNSHKYPYKVKNITRIQRSRDRCINVYSLNPATLVEEVKEFSFKSTLAQFPKQYNIEKYFKQAQQSWLVNASMVKEIRTVDMELVLFDGTVVPTSKKFIENFIKT